MIAKASRHKIFRSKKGIGKTIVTLISACVFGISMYLLWANYLSGHPYFRIQEIKVIGNQTVSSRLIIDTLQLDKGQTMLTLNREQLTKRIESIPAIKQASLIRRFPDSIYIKVTERTPAVWGLFNKQYYLLDKTGVVLERFSKPDRYSLPVMVGFSRGKTLKRQIRAGIKLIQELQAAGISRKVSRINLSDPDNITFTTALNLWVVNIGNSKNRTWLGKFQKLLQARKLTAHSSGRRNYVDLRFKDMAIVRPLTRFIHKLERHLPDSITEAASGQRPRKIYRQKEI